MQHCQWHKLRRPRVFLQLLIPKNQRTKETRRKKSENESKEEERKKRVDRTVPTSSRPDQSESQCDDSSFAHLEASSNLPFSKLAQHETMPIWNGKIESEKLNCLTKRLCREDSAALNHNRARENFVRLSDKIWLDLNTSLADLFHFSFRFLSFPGSSSCIAITSH
jgi:hypothetical protein